MINDFCLSLLFVAVAFCANCGLKEAGCPAGKCCSYWGYCGTTTAYCGSGSHQCACDCNGSKPCVTTSNRVTLYCYDAAGKKYTANDGAVCGGQYDSAALVKLIATSKGGNIYFRVHFKGGEWSKEYTNNGLAFNNNKPIDGIMMKYVGFPGSKYGPFVYQVRTKANKKWSNEITGYNANLATGYAGVLGQEIDAVRVFFRPIPTKTIFIGDTRTVGMQAAVGKVENTRWSAKADAGYDWMVSTGVKALPYDKTNLRIVILMGLHDLLKSNYAIVANRYISYLNKNAPEWAKMGGKTYFVSVNPSKMYSTVDEPKILSFNSSMKAGLKDIKYIDTYSYVKSIMKTTDGIEYSAETYRLLHKYIVSKL